MKKNIYCVYCGEKNNIQDLKCKKCKKKLNPKQHEFLDYIKDHIKDDLKGKVQDKVISIIKNFIISHLYGTVLTATLIFTIVSGIVTTVNENKNIEKVTQKPSILVSKVEDKCDFENSKEQILVCEEGYKLEDDKCIKEEKIDAELNYYCNDNYYFDGNKCVSNETFEIIIEEECLLPEDNPNALDVRVENGECLVNICAGWTDGECSAGGLEPIDFTITEYCPNGTTKINGECKIIDNYDIYYSCEEGTLEDDKCIIDYEEDSILTCEEGYTFNEDCNLCILGE